MQTNENLTAPDIEEAAAALREGRTTSVELVGQCLERADRLDPVLGSYLARFDESALEAARQADEELASGRDRGPLHGVPISLKDLIASREGPTSGQSRSLPPDWWAGIDAPVVARLREAGAVIVGKTATLEFASGFPGPDSPFPLSRNPWDPDAWAGGSSSGAANGLATGMSIGAVGTDTGASVRMPSAFCGVTGLIPTYGTVPTGHVIALAPSLDRVGPITHSAHDCGVMLDAMTDGRNLRRPAHEAPTLDGLRIGVVHEHHFPTGAEPTAVDVFDEAVGALRAAGALTTPVRLPHYQRTVTAASLISFAEGFSEHRARLAERWNDYEPMTKQVLGLGAFISSADYLQAQKVRRAAQLDLASLFRDVDVIVTPTASVEAIPIETIEREGVLEAMQHVHTFYWNAMGNPVLSVPMGVGGRGLPLGMQVAGRPHEDSVVLAVGEAFQSQTDWHRARPLLESLVR